MVKLEPEDGAGNSTTVDETKSAGATITKDVEIQEIVMDNLMHRGMSQRQTNRRSSAKGGVGGREGETDELA